MARAINDERGLDVRREKQVRNFPPLGPEPLVHKKALEAVEVYKSRGNPLNEFEEAYLAKHRENEE